MGLVSKLLSFYQERKDPVKFAKKIGVTVGNNCRFIGPQKWGSEPFLITIGDNTLISFECAFVTHDGSTWVFREQEKYKKVKRFGRITIGNNCFIGCRSTILPGVTIGDNAIIGAGSLVTKSVPEGEVWGGVPAKYITTVDEFADKCLDQMPDYDPDEYANNREEVIKKICDKM